MVGTWCAGRANWNHKHTQKVTLQNNRVGKWRSTREQDVKRSKAIKQCEARGITEMKIQRLQTCVKEKDNMNSNENSYSCLPVWPSSNAGCHKHLHGCTNLMWKQPYKPERRDEMWEKLSGKRKTRTKWRGRKERVIKIHNCGMKPQSDNQNRGGRLRQGRRVQDVQYKINTH